MNVHKNLKARKCKRLLEMLSSSRDLSQGGAGNSDNLLEKNEVKIMANIEQQFQVLSTEELMNVEGGKFGMACLGYGAASFAAGGAAVTAASTGAGIPAAIYLGAQALATGATLFACLSKH